MGLFSEEMAPPRVGSGEPTQPTPMQPITTTTAVLEARVTVPSAQAPRR